MGIGPTEWVLIIVALLVLFGGRKIPEFMRGLGQGMREFKKGMRGEDEPNASSPDNQKKVEPPKA
jgi:sec-independent protein translocase protein TatA